MLGRADRIRVSSVASMTWDMWYLNRLAVLAYLLTLLPSEISWDEGGV